MASLCSIDQSNPKAWGYFDQLRLLRLDGSCTGTHSYSLNLHESLLQLFKWRFMKHQ